MSILAVNNLTKIYTVGGDTTAALDHVSFSVEEGSFVAIVGTSGSGKSTLLHLIGGVDRPTEGSVFVDGVFYKDPLQSPLMGGCFPPSGGIEGGCNLLHRDRVG